MTHPPDDQPPTTPPQPPHQVPPPGQYPPPVQPPYPPSYPPPGYPPSQPLYRPPQPSGWPGYPVAPRPWYPAPPPPPKRKVPVWLIVLLSAVGVLVACCTLPSLLFTLQMPATTDTTSSDAAVSPTDTPAAAIPAAPSSPAMVTGGVLGGTTDDFSTALGSSPLDPNSDTQWYATVAGQRVLVTVTYAPAGTTIDGTARIAIIVVNTPNGALTAVPWDAATMKAIAQSFLPPDATFVRSEKEQGYNRTDQIYHSDLLANTFDASLFTNDSGGRQVTPGTLYWECNSQSGCYMSVGTYN